MLAGGAARLRFVRSVASRAESRVESVDAIHERPSAALAASDNLFASSSFAVPTIGCTPISDDNRREPDERNGSQRDISHRQWQRQLQGDHQKPEGKRMTGKEGVRLVPDRIATKRGGDPKSIDVISGHPSQQKRNG